MKVLHKLFTVLLLLFCVSCLQTKATPDHIFGLKLKEVMAEAESFNSPLFSPFEQTKLSRPVGTWLWLMEIDSDYCLFYLTPLNRQKTGILRLNHRPGSGCREAFGEDIIVELDELQSLRFVELSHRKRKLGPRQEWDIKGERLGVAFHWEIFSPLLADKSTKRRKNLAVFRQEL
jgi:hypothetical protein